MAQPLTAAERAQIDALVNDPVANIGLRSPLSPAQQATTDHQIMMDNSSSLSRNFSAGLRDIAGQTHALLGQGAELVGAKDFAASQRAASVASQQEAERYAAGTPSWEQVDGLRSGFDYATGLVGRSLPALGAGVAGAALAPAVGLGGAVGGIAGMTAATAPSTIGAQLEAQQNDPVQAQKGAWERTGAAALAGTAQAAAMSVVPQMVGGKLFGRAAEGAAAKTAMPFGRAAMENVPEAVLGNAAAGNVSARIGQQAAGYLNPERDTSHDWAEQKDAMIGGAVISAPFAAAGTLGAMRGKQAGAAPGEPLPRSTEAERAAGVPLAPQPETAGAAPAPDTVPPAPKTFTEQVAALAEPLKTEPVTAAEHTAPIVEGDTPETMAAKDAEGQSAATAKAQRVLDKLLADTSASQFHDELGKIDPTTSAGQNRAVELNVQHFEAKQAAKAVNEGNAALDAFKTEEFPDVQFSKDHSGADKKIGDMLDKNRDWDYPDEGSRSAAVSMLRKIIETSERTGRLPAEAQNAAGLLLGKNPVARLTEMYDALGAKEPAKADRFYGALGQFDAARKVDASLLEAVRSALPEHMIDKVKTPQIKDFVAQMKDLTGERMFKDMTPAEQAVKKAQIHSKLAEVFGDKVDDVAEAFRKHAMDEQAFTMPDNAESAKLKSVDEGGAGDDGEYSQFAGERADPLLAADSGAQKPTYYGMKGDNPFMLSDAAHERAFPNTPGDARPQSRRLTAALNNPEHGEVAWQSARDHAREVGMSDEDLLAHTGGKPDEYGLVRALPKSDDKFALTSADIESMKLGVHSREFDPASNGMINKRLAPKKSWIEEGESTITLPGVKADLSDDVHFDATRIASWMARKDGKNVERSVTAEGKGDLYRTAQAFAEGVAALTHHYGRKIDVPDETIVVKAKGNRPAATWGELKQVLKDGDMDAQARTELSPLREKRDALLAAREDARLKVQNANDVGPQELQTLMAKSDAGFTGQLADVNSRIAEARKAAAERVDMSGDFEGSGKTTAKLTKMVSDLTLRADESGKEVARLTALAGKRALTDWQQRQLERHQQTVDKLGEMIPNLEAAIEKRGDRATFAEAKELGNDYGTGRDSGGGIDLRREQMRVAERDKSTYNGLMDRLNQHAPGSPAEAVAWKVEAQRVERRLAQMTKDVKGGSEQVKAAARPEYRKLLDYQKVLAVKDRAGLERLHDTANAAIGATGKEIGIGDNGKPFVVPEKGTRDETPLGVSAIDPAGQIHLADADYGYRLGEVSARSRQVAGEYTAPLGGRGDPVKPVTPEQRWTALNARADAMQAAKSANVKELGGMLRGLIDNHELLTPTHKKELGKVLDKKTALAMGPGIKALHDQYSGNKKWSADGANAWSNVASEGGHQHAAILKRVSKSLDVKALKTSVLELLADRKPNATKQEVIAAINDRISELIAKDPSVGYGLLTKGNEPPAHLFEGMQSRVKIDPAVVHTSKMRAELVAHINKVTGDSVDVNAASRNLGFAGSYKEGHTDADGVDHRPAINVSIHALDPTSVGYHESLHWFADHLRQHGDPKVFAALTKVADSPYVRNFLRNVFKDQPDALAQVMGSAEERVAYMYQFHANGQLKLGERGKTMLDKIGDYIRSVLGVWTNDRRAEHIMDYFHSGEYAKAMAAGAGERSPAYQYMMEQGRNKTLDYLHKNAAPLIQTMEAVAGIGSARVHDMGIPALSKMADMVRLHGTKEGADAGYLPAAGTAMRTFSNKMVNRMGKFSFEEANEAFAAIALGKAPKDAAQVRVMNGMRDTLDEMHAYLKEAGVNVGDRGLGKNYVPRQWDSAYVAGHQPEFRAMIQKYIDNGQFKGTADSLMSRLMRDEGSELESADAKGRPGDQHVKTRELHFITADDAAPFLEKNAMRVLTSYIKQGTRRAEWSRRFELKADGKDTTPMEELRAAALKQGATPDQMKIVDKYLEGVTGQLGSDVHPETRKLFGQVMVYQNLRLLPMGFFSSLIDPVGVAVRGGGVRDVFNNFKRGIMEIPRGFQKNPKYDEGYHLAEDMGVIDNAVLQHVMGASYGLNAVGNKARAVNETLFKWNLMEQMNTSQRVAATEAAMGFLKKHKGGDFNAHSPRYLAELGLKPDDIKLVGAGKDARVAVRAEDFIQLGMKADAAEAAHLKMKQAVNSWVDGAVLRPDQSQKAIWMNDAHFSLIAHMKQFAFAFQDTILKRVLNEAKYGNYQPAVALAGYIPVMLAADLTKGLIQGGGVQPDWKQDWGLDDYLGSAVQRAGLFGVGQFGVDAVKDLHHGGMAVGALGGPTLGQLGEVVSTVGGHRGFAATAIDSMPANSLWSGYLPNGMTHPNAAGGEGGFAPTELNTVD